MEHVIIRTLIVSNTDDHLMAIRYINEKMRQVFLCEPPETKGIVCVAYIGSEIRATLAIQGTTENMPFSLEEHYEFDRSTCPFPFHRTHLVQATRWISTHRSASLHVISAAARLAKELGKTHMLMEGKPKAVERLREIGMICEQIPNAILQTDKIESMVGNSGMKYYLETPLPRLYMLPIREMRDACLQEINKLTSG